MDWLGSEKIRRTLLALVLAIICALLAPYFGLRLPSSRPQRPPPLLSTVPVERPKDQPLRRTAPRAAPAEESGTKKNGNSKLSDIEELLGQ